MSGARSRSVAAGVGFVLLVAAGQLLRQTGTTTWNSMWAEDASIYTTDVFAHPAWTTLLRGYQGYAQFVPRLLVLPMAVIGPRGVAPYAAVMGALVTGLLALGAVRWSATLLRSPVLPWFVGAMVALAPVGLVEINANLVNLSWSFVAVSFWAVAARPTTRGATAARATTVALAGLTTPLQVVMVPWAILVVARRRARADKIVLGAMVGGLVVQVLAIRVAERAAAHDPVVAGDLAEQFAVRVVGSFVVGERWLPDLFLQHSRALMAGSALVVLAVIVVSRPQRQDLDRRLMGFGGIGIAVVVFALSGTFRGAAFVGLRTPDGAFDPGGSRYSYIPIFLLFSGLIVLVDGSGRAWLSWLLMAQTVVVIAASMYVSTPRSVAPSWSVGVERAREACAARDGSPGTVEIPVAPGAFWWATVPCDRLPAADPPADRPAGPPATVETGSLRDRPTSSPS